MSIAFGIYALLDLFVSMKQRKLYRVICFYALTAIGLVGILLLSNAYVFLPSFFAKTIQLPYGYDAASSFGNLSFTTITHALFLYHPNWYQNVFGVVHQPAWYFVAIPLLALSGFLLWRGNSSARYLCLLLLIGLFLTKGSNPPFGEINIWFFQNIPGFTLFRDSSKFFLLVVFTFSLFIGKLFTLVPDKFRIYAYTGFSLFILLILSPTWIGKMTGSFSPPLYLNELQTIADTIEDDSSFSRSVWLPTKPPLGYVSYLHPSVDAWYLTQKRPFAIGIIGNYELFNFLRDAPFVGELLKISGIKYIAYPYPDERRQELKPEDKKYYDTFLNQLTDAPWSAGLVTGTGKRVPIIKTKESTDHFFIAPNHFFVVGSDEIYNGLVKVPGFDLSKNAITFVEEKNVSEVSHFPNPNIILYKKDLLDLTFSMMQTELIFPANQLQHNPNETGWWKREAGDLIPWRAFLQEKYGIDNLDFDYGGGWAIGEGDVQLQMPNTKWREGRLLFVRMMKSSRGGSVEFWQGDNKIGEVNTKDDFPEKEELIIHGNEEKPDQVLEYDSTNISWFSVGTLLNDEPVIIKTHGDINVVNAITAFPKEDYQRTIGQIEKLQIDGKVLDWSTLSETEKADSLNDNDHGEVSYQRVNPTHYKVKISGITRSQTLIFSETYDSLWQLDGQSSFSVYSMLNGFRIDHNGEYDLYFTAQRYVWPSLIISGLTLALLIISIIVLRKRKNLV